METGKQQQAESKDLMRVSEEVATIQTITKILIAYDKLMPPSEKVFALLAFEADYIIKKYLKHPLVIQTETGLKPQDHTLNIIPKDIWIGFIQFQYLLSKSFPFEQYSAENPAPTIIKNYYLRLINLLLHNESFQAHADDHWYITLKRIQGAGIVDEERLQQVLNLVQLRLHNYKIISGRDGTFD